MKTKQSYRAPQVVWRELEQEALICDSYVSGIDDLIGDEIDWEL